MSESHPIKVLPEEIANRIAAGEIIERPASVIRELLDNAIDAGACRIEIEVRNGGKSLISVTDNGFGMSADGLLLAFERHATSKITSLDDLDAIDTLGFRGEALPSIASVAKVEVESFQQGTEHGSRIFIEGGKIRKIESVVCKPGVRFKVRSLFFNVPARRKFLRTPKTEYGHVLDSVIDHAVTYPGIHFIFRDEDRCVIDAPAVDRWASRIQNVFGSRYLNNMLPLDTVINGIKIQGFISQPDHLQATGRSQRLYLNGRRIRDRIITQAVYRGYQEYLTSRGHPVILVRVTLDPDMVDVNVHPAKSEVRFQDPNRVFDAVRQSIQAVLGRSLRKHIPDTGNRMPPPVMDQKDRLTYTSPGQLGSTPASTPYGSADHTSEQEFVGQTPVQAQFQAFSTALGNWRVVGQVFNTFILVEMGDDLLVIDQHTAHERILFESFKTLFTGGMVPGQSLMFPVSVSLDPQQAAAIAESSETLQRMGVSLEHFGKDSFLVRALPQHVQDENPVVLLRDIADELVDVGSSDRTRAMERMLLITLSCRRAIKAGDVLDTARMTALVESLMAMNLPGTCPHGRPIIVSMHRGDLEHRFKR